MKYDDASWHSGGDFPEDSPEEYGATHIALFLRWCFSKGWAGDIHTQDSPKEVVRVISGDMTATDFFLQHCGGKLTDEDFNDEGNTFASIYYGDKGLYLSDYAEKFGDQMYIAPEQSHDYQAFCTMLDNRFKNKALEKNWWKFW